MSEEGPDPTTGSEAIGDAADPRDRFVRLLDPVLPPAYAAARHLTRDADDAEDLVQEASLKAWNGFDGFEPGTNFKAWFLRILTHAFYDSYRRSRRAPDTVPIDGEADHHLYHRLVASRTTGRPVNPAEAFLRRLDGSHIEAALDALPDEFRAAAVLYFVEDLSYQEIADALACPLGTVRSRLHRGRQRLQVALWRIAEEHGLVGSGDGGGETGTGTDGSGPRDRGSGGRSLSLRNGSP
ncbi:MAG TPA: sigma-70 family RNA polymerase sigma factor [Gemmatimonadota bacterium]|nr:sigma-70 family RNA polymerase sigma factor [Gemmatimonadota bacterium]